MLDEAARTVDKVAASGNDLPDAASDKPAADEGSAAVVTTASEPDATLAALPTELPSDRDATTALPASAEVVLGSLLAMSATDTGVVYTENAVLSAEPTVEGDGLTLLTGPEGLLQAGRSVPLTPSDAVGGDAALPLVSQDGEPDQVTESLALNTMLPATNDAVPVAAPVVQGVATPQSNATIQSPVSTTLASNLAVSANLAMTETGQSSLGQGQQGDTPQRQASEAKVITAAVSAQTVASDKPDDAMTFRQLIDATAVTDKSVLPPTTVTTASLTPAGQPLSSSSTTSSQLGLPLHHPRWADGLGDRVIWMVNQGVQNADLKLNPAHLGQLDVRISVADGQATVSFASPHQYVRDAIESAMPRLREMMQDGGLSLADANVSDQSPREQRHQAMAEGERGRGYGSDVMADDQAIDIASARPLAMRGIVDYYA